MPQPQMAPQQPPMDPNYGYQIPTVPASKNDNIKNIIILVAVVAVIVLVIVFASSGSKDDNSGSTNNGGNNINEPGNNNGGSSNNGGTTTTTKENTVVITTKKANTKLNLNEKVTVENGEFKVTNVNITNKVEPPKKSSWYTYYESDKDKVYIDVVIEYKNTGTSSAEADEIVNGKLTYRDVYTYSGFEIIEEDNRSDFTYANITDIAPLTTEYLHYLFEVPSSVKSDNGKLEATLIFGDKSFDLIVRDGVTGQTNTNGDSKIVKDKEITKGTTEVIKGIAEFTVESANITTKVEPPKKDDFYTYYEADNGKVYVDVVIAYKNLGQDPKDADEAVKSGSLKYDNTYDYTGFTTIEEDNGQDFTYTNITTIKPLVTDKLHYLFEVPAEVASSNKPIKVSFKVAENTYIYTVR
jgi:hypothetical protein